jgi:hypothetical protein
MDRRPCPIKLVDALAQDGSQSYQGAHYSEERDVI